MKIISLFEDKENYEKYCHYDVKVKSFLIAYKEDGGAFYTVVKDRLNGLSGKKMSKAEFLALVNEVVG